MLNQIGRYPASTNGLTVNLSIKSKSVAMFDRLLFLLPNLPKAVTQLKKSICWIKYIQIVDYAYMNFNMKKQVILKQCTGFG